MRQVYASSVPGDETSKPVKSSLTLEELQTQALVQAYVSLVQAARQTEEDLAKVRRECKHFKFFDLPGHPCDCRQCAVCGKFMGAV